jgi:hypothetical protein
MKSFATLWVILAATLPASPLAAAEIRGQPKAVVELFTSQGCSSCPKADQLLAEIGQQNDVIALAYHVDYWDYIGWTDTFGSAANSERQKAYARAWGSSRIYTPQMVVNGTKAVVGSRAGDVNDAINDAQLAVPVDLVLGQDVLDVSVGAQPGGKDATVWLVTFKEQKQVRIERGENAGKLVDYTQIVTGRHLLGMWDADKGTHLKLPLSQLMTGASDGAAILVQSDKDGEPGPIIGAASVEL